MTVIPAVVTIAAQATKYEAARLIGEPPAGKTFVQSITRWRKDR